VLGAAVEDKGRRMDRDVVDVAARVSSASKRVAWILRGETRNQKLKRSLLQTTENTGPNISRNHLICLAATRCGGNDFGRPPLAVAMCHTATYADDDASQLVRRRRESLLTAVPGSAQKRKTEGPETGRRTRDRGMAGSLLSRLVLPAFCWLPFGVGKRKLGHQAASCSSGPSLHWD
jgi:hypothetical protein